MENEVKQRNQRNRRRERAQRMQAQRESKVKDGDSGEDESPAREKPPRPPARRKKSREPLGEEDIIDGFAIMAFRTYEDLETAVKCASSPRTIALSTKPRLPLAALAGDATRNHTTSNVNSHGITLLQDAGTSDDSGRASERLTGSSVAPRDPDSSRDRLSDASSRCSSGKGYICDSEGDDDKASPENSRNASPRYHDASMDDASDAGSLFRVTGAGGGGAVKNELVARGGSGGALALSRAPVGGSASPAPAPLPQPAPSPAPAALPPPALPPPPFRADTPHRNNGAHIPALDGQAATQIPARPVGAAGPDTPERPASNNKLQPGARAAAESPTPAPPAPPAPSPLFPSHTAYQAHAAAALPDYRHTNHETRTEPQQPEPPHAPLDLHAHQPAPRPPHPPHLAPAATPPTHPSLPSRVPHSQPHPVIPGHDVRNASPAQAQIHPSVPTSFPKLAVANGVPQNIASQPPPASAPSSLPSQPPAGRPSSPAAPISRPFPAPSIGSSHVNSSISSSIHSHSIPYPGQSSLQKHSVQPMYASRPSHHTAFSVANHISANHLPPTTSNPPAAMHFTHPLSSHSIMSHANIPMSGSNPLATSTPNHISSPHLSSTTTTSTISSFTPSIKHPGLSLPPHPASLAPTVSLHQPMNIDPTPISSAPTVLTPASSSSSVNSHSIVPPIVDSRPLAISASDIPARSENATVSSAMAPNGYPPPAVYSAGSYPALYAPYAPTLQHSPYLPPSAASPRNTADTRTSLSASPLVAPKTPKGVRPHTPGSLAAHAPLSYSPRGHSPGRERESFSSNISSLSRSTVASSGATAAPTVSSALTAPLAAPLVAPLAGPLPAPLPGPVPALGVSPGLGPLSTGLSALGGLTGLAAPTPTAPAPAPHLAQTLAPVPTVPSISSSAKPPAHWGVTRPTGTERSGFAPAPPLFGAPLPPPNPNPFSAESLFQTSPGADLLRRELDNRFLAAAGAVGVRTELHHHQHQHTHVHQHPPATHAAHAAHAQHAAHAPLAPHAPHAPPAPHHPHQLLVPHAPLFKDVGKMTSLYRTGLSLGYPYSSSLLHPTAPYVPPAPLTTYAPKPVVSAASDSATKPPPRPSVAKTGKWNAMHVRIAWEIYNHQQKEKSGGAAGAGADKDKLRAFPAPAPPPPAYRSPYELPPAPYLPHHAPLGMVRYPARPALAPPPDRHLGVSPFARYGAGAFPPAPAPFALSAYGRELALSSSLHGMHHAPMALHDAWRGARPPAAAAAEARREHEERERARRDREERERRDREERERRKLREQREREMERARTRSPLRNGVPEPPKEERKEPPRPPPSLPAYPPPSHWDPYRFDPLQHMRFAPFVEAAIRAEEDRAKMLNAYAHHQQLKSSPLLHRALPGGPLPPLGAHASLAPSLAPLAPLDLLKKEEPR